MASPKDKAWTNPMDIMKKTNRLRSTRRLSRSQSLNLSKRGSLTNENLSDSKDGSENSLKRRNPFICDQPAAKHVMHLNHSHSFSATNAQDKRLASADFFREDLHENEDKKDGDSIGKSCRSIQDKLQEVKDKTNIGQDFSSVDSNLIDKSELDTDIKTIYPKPVIDWSLKTKMRVLIEGVKTDNCKLPGLDAKHLDAFVHCEFEKHEWHNLDVHQQIRRCCFHYSFPCMPWMSTFPRLASHYKSKFPLPAFTANTDVLDSLQKEWSKALLSVYQQLRAGLCPYFYVCTHQFTVLFRCLRSKSTCSLSALLSPSTRGLREVLKKEGISFQMPNLRKDESLINGIGQSDQSTDSTRPFENDDKNKRESGDGSNNADDGNETSSLIPADGREMEENDDAEVASTGVDKDDDDNLAFEWLEDMGLDKQDFPSLRPHNVKLQRENYQDIDNRSQSMVYIQGLDVHAFFNFLQNFSGCIASSGPQYGLPPTIISPHPFEGGTLVCNSVKQSVIQGQTYHQNGIKLHSLSECGDGFSKKSSQRVIEISGPILPHHSLNISAILKAAGSMSRLSYSVHQPTTAFNSSEICEDQVNIMNTGLSKLLVPFSLSNLGLMKGVEEVMLSGIVRSVGDGTVSSQGFTYD